jgi:hypothetical protein
MQTRRVFLQSSAVAIGGLSSWHHSLAKPIIDSSKDYFYKIIFDDRQQESKIFANEVTKFGTPTLGIQDDITSLWYDDLRDRLQNEKLLIGGLTTESVAFYLSMFARDVTYHQVLRGDHIYRNNTIEHRLSAPDYITEQASALKDTSHQWGRPLAHLMHSYERQIGSPTKSTLGDNVQVRSDEPNRLVSWILAPIYI